MPTFDFVTRPDLRKSLEFDYQELELCLKARAWKAAHVLAGSIIETLLVDHLISSNLPNCGQSDVIKLGLADLIALCRKENILSQKAADLSSAIKHYRNLIHPGRSLRLNEKADEPGAKVAEALVDIIVNEISSSKKETYGYTAEQIVSKLIRDNSAIAIINHILKSSSEYELERLLTEVIPKQYLSLVDDEDPYDRSSNTHKILEKSFRQAYALLPNDAQKRVVEKFIKILKEDDGEYVAVYGVAFFRAKDIEHLSDENRVLVKEHYLSRIKNNFSEELAETLEGIGRYCTIKEINDLTDTLIRIVITGETKPLKDRARKMIEHEHIWLKPKESQTVKDRLSHWASHFQRKGLASHSETIKAIKASIEEEIPF